MDEDSVYRVPESIGEEQREEDAKEGWSKDTALLHSILDGEGFRAGSVKLNGPTHILMKGHNHAQKLGGASNPLEEGKQSFTANQVKGLGQVNEGQVQGFSLLPAFLLQLPH